MEYAHLFCFSIALNVLIKQEVLINSEEKVERQIYSLLVIPLIALGGFMTWLVF